MAVAFFDGQGQHQWTKAVPKPERWTEDVYTRGQIAGNGSRIVVSLTPPGDHLLTAVVVFDRYGDVVASPPEFIHMAPSGRYFYGSNYSYREREFILYDDQLQTVDTAIEEALEIDRSRYRYSLTYKVLDNDVMFIDLYEYVYVSQTGRVQRHLRHGKQKAFRNVLYWYDLTGDSLLTSYT
ncbi:MAG: hypothetical protein AAF730_19470, partial [Bacteroidota bacterium]